MMLAPTQVHTPTSSKSWRSGFLGNLRLRSSRRTQSDAHTIALAPQSNQSTQRYKVSGLSSSNSTSALASVPRLSPRTHTKHSSDVSAIGLLADLNPVTGAPVQAAPAPAFPMSFDGNAARRPPFPTSASFSDSTQVKGASVFKPMPILRKDSSSPPRVNVVLEKPVMPKPPRGTLNTPQKLAYVDWRLQVIQDEQMEDDEHRELLLEPTSSIQSDDLPSAPTSAGSATSFDFAPAPTPGESRSRMTSSASAAPAFLSSDPHKATRAASVSRQRSTKVKIAARPATADAMCVAHPEGTPGQFARSASYQLKRTGSVTHGNASKRSGSVSHGGPPTRFGSFTSSIKSFGRPQTPDPNYSQLAHETSPRTSTASLGGFKSHSYAESTGFDESLEELDDAEEQRAAAREMSRPVSRVSRPVSRNGNGRPTVKGDAKRWTKIVVTAMGGFAPQHPEGSDASDSD